MIKYKVIVLVIGVVLIAGYSYYVNPMMTYSDNVSETVSINSEGCLKMMAVRTGMWIFVWYGILFAIPYLFRKYFPTEE